MKPRNPLTTDEQYALRAVADLYYGNMLDNEHDGAEYDETDKDMAAVLSDVIADVYFDAESILANEAFAEAMWFVLTTDNDPEFLDTFELNRNLIVSGVRRLYAAAREPIPDWLEELL